MKELFGIPMDTLAAVLAILVAVLAGSLGALALRHRVLLKLGVRNLGRRRARSALIVVGLMLGTTIIAAALATGDTMTHTIRATTTQALGETDEIVAAKGAADDISGELGAASGTGYFDQRVVADVERALAGKSLTDGVMGAIVEDVAVQAPLQRQTEPSVTLFAPDPAAMGSFAPIRRVDGGTVSLDELSGNQAYLNKKAADALHVRTGDPLIVYVGGKPVRMRIRDVVRFKGATTADTAMLLPLREAQRLYGQEGRIKGIAISNRGRGEAGVGLSDDVVSTLKPIVTPLGLETSTSKADAIDLADELGNAFMSLFTTFGTFSISAGILLIFLIFVMLATERRGELGIARAVGTRRGHLVQMFTFEGAAYDLIAAAVGAILGAGIAYLMVLAIASAFGAADEDAGIQVHYAVTSRSLFVAFSIGALLTLLVVAFSAWRVSVMTIATAIRNLPEPKLPRRRRRLVLALVSIGLGALLTASGAGSASATPLMLGVCLVLIGLVPVLRLVGVSERLAYTSCGLAISVAMLLPWSVWESVFGQISMNFTTWIVAGLMTVIGAVWVLVYNADLLLRAISFALSPFGRVAPVAKMAITYPLRARFRTGATLAMFTLVVFTLVTGTASSGSFEKAFGTVDEFGGGFQVRAGTSATAPIDNMEQALQHARGIDSRDFLGVGSQSVLSVKARQLRTGRPAESYVARGLDDDFLVHTTFGLGAMARGYGSAPQVWRALAEEPGLAVVDATVAPHRDNFNFAVLPDFQLSGFSVEDGVFDPIPLSVRDPQTGRQLQLKVIGILKDSAPEEMVGISSSQATYQHAFPGRFDPTIHYFALAPGVDPETTATKLESAFLANGMQAESIQSVVDDAVASSRTFNRLIQGFMMLGLVVGVAALGVISARAVVERRQQIGVLRAIGFRQGMVQAVFLLESSFIALTSIVAGTVLGLILAQNIVHDSAQQPSWENLTLVVPWGNFAVIFLLVYAVAVAATLAPAVRASRIRPAEALRYQ
ncbi:MAG TPA: FtsX-like permease family protein [Gaiellaceae bacterium]